MKGDRRVVIGDACPHCGYVHPTYADVHMCRVVQGIVTETPLEARLLYLTCLVDGYRGSTDAMVWHFAAHHRHQPFSSGCLVRLTLPTGRLRPSEWVDR